MATLGPVLSTDHGNPSTRFFFLLFFLFTCFIMGLQVRQPTILFYFSLFLIPDDDGHLYSKFNATGDHTNIQRDQQLMTVHRAIRLFLPFPFSVFLLLIFLFLFIHL